MAPVKEFHTSGDEDHHEAQYHNQSECPYGLRIIRNAHYVRGRRAGDGLCAHCQELALEGSYLFARSVSAS
jgi:hypothetical protein